MKCQAAGGQCFEHAVVEMYCAMCRDHSAAGKRSYCATHKGGRPACGHDCSHSTSIGGAAPAALDEETIVPTMHYANDEAALVAKVEASKGSRRFIFAGEAHDTPYDKERTYAIATAYRNDAAVIVVAERAIFAPRPAFALGGMVSEADLVSSSMSPARDKNVVTQMLQLCAADDAAARSRPVLILFGDAHAATIKVELRARLGVLAPAPPTLRWSHYPCGKDYLTPSAAVGGMTPVGFCLGPMANTDRQIVSLSKGFFIGNFALKITRAMDTPWAFKPLYGVYAAAGATADGLLDHFEGNKDRTVAVTDNVAYRLVYIPGEHANRRDYDAHMAATNAAAALRSQVP